MLKVSTSHLPREQNDSYSNLVAKASLSRDGYPEDTFNLVVSWELLRLSRTRRLFLNPRIANWVEQLNYWEPWKAMKRIDVKKQTTEIEYNMLWNESESNILPAIKKSIL